MGLQLLYNYAGYDPEQTYNGYIPIVGDKIFKMVSRVTFIAYLITFVLFALYPLNKKKLQKQQEELAVKRQARAKQLAMETQTAAEQP